MWTVWKDWKKWKGCPKHDGSDHEENITPTSSKSGKCEYESDDECEIAHEVKSWLCMWGMWLSFEKQAGYEETCRN